MQKVVELLQQVIVGEHANALFDLPDLTVAEKGDNIGKVETFLYSTSFVFGCILCRCFGGRLKIRQCLVQGFDEELTANE